MYISRHPGVYVCLFAVIYRHIHEFICMYAYIYVQVHTYIYVVHMYADMNKCVYVCRCMCVCM